MEDQREGLPLDLEFSQVMSKKDLIEMLQLQLTEYEMLQSMFSNPGELSTDDPTVLYEINNFINGLVSINPPHLDFVIKMQISEAKVALYVHLPTEYPSIEPEIYVKCDKFSRQHQHLVNKALEKYLSGLEKGELCIGSVVQWLNENAMEYFKQEITEKKVMRRLINSCRGRDFVRLWIYSHHIYNGGKRKKILELSDEYKLTGFCLPGRPGIICVEGDATACDEWWQEIKGMNWKKIACRKREVEPLEDMEVDILRRFPDFRELTFDTNPGRSKDRHVDFGEFYRYLRQYGCEYVFKDYFGIAGRQAGGN